MGVVKDLVMYINIYIFLQGNVSNYIQALLIAFGIYVDPTSVFMGVGFFACSNKTLGPKIFVNVISPLCILYIITGGLD